MRNKLLFFVLSFSVFPTAIAASFDCANASHSVERLICASSELNRLDEEAANAYREAIKDPSTVFEVKASQREWIKETRKCADESCLQALYLDRVKFLKDAAARNQQVNTETKLAETTANHTEKSESLTSVKAQSAAANQSENPKSERNDQNFAIYLIAFLVLGCLGYFLKKLISSFGSSTTDSTGTSSPNIENLSNSSEATSLSSNKKNLEPDTGVVDYDPAMFAQDDVTSDSEIDIEKSELTGRFSLKTARNNQAIFNQLMLDIGFEGGGGSLLGLYFTEDPRFQSENDIGLAGAWNSCMASQREEKTRKIIASLHKFERNPDVYTLWKYVLVNQYASTDANGSTNAEFSSPFLLLEKIGGDVDQCVSAMNEVGSIFRANQISEQNYQDAMKSLVLCYLAAAFNTDDSFLCVRNLMLFIGVNEPLCEVSFESGSWGEGEHMQACRRVVEELANVRLEAPEGVDHQRDGYFDDIDWDDVADKVHSHLA